MRLKSFEMPAAREQAAEVLAGEGGGKNQIYLAETIIKLCDEMESILHTANIYIEIVFNDIKYMEKRLEERWKNEQKS